MYYTLCIHWIGCVCNGVLCTALCDPIWILGGWIPSRKLHLGVRNPPYQTRHRADHRLVWFPRDVSHVELSHMLRLLSPPITTYMCNWLLWMMLCLVVLFFCVFCCFVFLCFVAVECWSCEGVKAWRRVWCRVTLLCGSYFGRVLCSLVVLSMTDQQSFSQVLLTHTAGFLLWLELYRLLRQFVQPGPTAK